MVVVVGGGGWSSVCGWLLLVCVCGGVAGDDE